MPSRKREDLELEAILLKQKQDMNNLQTNKALAKTKAGVV